MANYGEIVIVMDKNYIDKTPLISIIVPVFNVEAYVEKCIDSLIIQSYRNIEIIIVDDGSTDRSGEICDRYKEKDSRIMVVHKSNGGLSDARNIGINMARGEYVSFVDSDDWVARDYVSEMYKLMVQTNSDITFCKFKKISKIKESKRKTEEVHKIYFKEEAIKQLLYQRISTSAWGKLYKADLWNGVRFPVGKLYEDVETIYLIFHKSKKVSSINKVLYYYYLRNDSIVNQKFTIKRMDYVENCRTLLKDVRIDYPQFENAAISRLMWAEIHVLVHMDVPKENSNEYRLLMNDVKHFRGVVVKDCENKLKTRAVAFLSYFGYFGLKSVYMIVR